jgi:hypothetical protein
MTRITKTPIREVTVTLGGVRDLRIIELRKRDPLNKRSEWSNDAISLSREELAAIVAAVEEK